MAYIDRGSFVSVSDRYAINNSGYTRSLSSREEYIMRKYRDYAMMAREFTNGNDIYAVANGLAMIDLMIEIRELPERMPVPKIPENKLDVRIVSDHINAAMSELYKS